MTAGLNVPADCQAVSRGKITGDSEARVQVPNGAACAERVQGDSAQARIHRARGKKKGRWENNIGQRRRLGKQGTCENSNSELAETKSVKNRCWARWRDVEYCGGTPYPGCFAGRVWICLIAKELRFLRVTKSLQEYRSKRVRAVERRASRVICRGNMADVITTVIGCQAISLAMPKSKNHVQIDTWAPKFLND